MSIFRYIVNRLRKRQYWRKVKVGVQCTVPRSLDFVSGLNSSGDNLIIGDYVSIASGCRFELSPNSRISIGTGSIISPSVIIFSRSHAYDHDNLSSIPFDETNYIADVLIEDACWIGQNAIILPGTKLGRGSVVGAGAVLTGKQYPPYAVLCGNPAVIVKYRDPERFEKLYASGKYRLKERVGHDIKRFVEKPGAGDN